MYPVAILAGGLSTRVRPITDKIPKVLINVAGKPFIYHQLELLSKQGISQVVLCLGYLGEQVAAAVGDGKRFGISINYSFDGEILMGTGGALKRALPMLGRNFFVLYGDAYLSSSYKAVQSAFEASDCPALMTVLRNDNQWDKSNVLFQHGELKEYNKRLPSLEMTHIDYGLGIVESSIFEALDDHPADLADIYQDLSVKKQLAGFEVNQRFYEIGTLKGIEETEEYLLNRGK